MRGVSSSIKRRSCPPPIPHAKSPGSIPTVHPYLHRHDLRSLPSSVHHDFTLSTAQTPREDYASALLTPRVYGSAASLHRCPCQSRVLLQPSSPHSTAAPPRRRNPRPPLTAQRSFQAATALHRSLPPPAQWWFHLLPDQCPGLPPTVPRSFPAAAALYHSLPPPATRCVPTAVSLLLPQITSGYLRSMPPPAQRWFPLPPEPRPGLPPPRPRWFLHPPEAGAASGPAPPAPRWFPAHLCLPPFFAICSRKCVMQVL
jgi:hypothetical protein